MNNMKNIDDKSLMSLTSVAVLGAGVMGSQIALELAKYGYKIFLFDKSIELAELGINKSISNISHKEQINGILSTEIYKNALNNINNCNYDDDLNKLKNCELVIEAIIEKIEAKEKLYTIIKPYLNQNTVLASNTSGLSIKELSKFAHNPELFCGLHFFNPPRHLPLVEYIKSAENNHKCNHIIQNFLARKVHFKFLNAKDTPNFIGNKIGFFAWLAVIHTNKKFNLSLEIADILSGELIGRSKSATYRTADIVGLDVVKHVIETMQNIQDDKFKNWYSMPESLELLISKNYLGQKSKKGFYTKDENNNILVWDNSNNSTDINYTKIKDAYKEIDKQTLSILEMEIDLSDKLLKLKNIPHQHAQFVVQIVTIVRDYIDYHQDDICYDKEDVMKAMKYGFGWQYI